MERYIRLGKCRIQEAHQPLLPRPQPTETVSLELLIEPPGYRCIYIYRYIDMIYIEEKSS